MTSLLFADAHKQTDGHPLKNFIFTDTIPLGNMYEKWVTDCVSWKNPVYGLPCFSSQFQRADIMVTDWLLTVILMTTQEEPDIPYKNHSTIENWLFHQNIKTTVPGTTYFIKKIIVTEISTWNSVLTLTNVEEVTRRMTTIRKEMTKECRIYSRLLMMIWLNVREQYYDNNDNFSTWVYVQGGSISFFTRKTTLYLKT